MITIFGATGNTGGEAARVLLGHKHAVRVIGRSQSRLSALVNQGAQAMQGDLQNADSVKRALDGADAAYVLIPPNFSVANFRQYQKQVTENITGALRDSGCRKVVLLSSLGANHASGTGPIVGLYELEQHLKSIDGLDVLAIRAAYFMENLFGSAGMVKAMGVLGSAAPPSVPVAVIASVDIGGYVAERIASPDFNGFQVVNLIGPAFLTFTEVARTLGEAIGKPNLQYVQFPEDEAKKGMVSAGLTEDMSSLYIEMNRAIGKGLLQPQPGTQVVHTATTLSTFAQRFAEVYRSASAA